MQAAYAEDHLGASLRPKHSTTQYSHPVQEIEQTRLARAELMTNFALQNIYGSHMPMRMSMERSMLSSFQRLPVLKSEMVGLSTITGSDMEMHFGEEFDETESADFTMGVHDLTEKKLRL
eukprot:TRINITY_DN2974_c0_g2_i1.p1 TRINITY_DN2974_c0_g2~~TRINITY_DN2974_c0_g2_i1.p1  ORF type:complete len:120 (-),score=32.29 TRINITY_DN2974_c0_g2_i1:74-433(-)